MSTVYVIQLYNQSFVKIVNLFFNQSSLTLQPLKVLTAQKD